MNNDLIEKETNKPNTYQVILHVQENNICNSKAMGVIETKPFNYGIFFFIIKGQINCAFSWQHFL